MLRQGATGIDLCHHISRIAENQQEKERRPAAAGRKGKQAAGDSEAPTGESALRKN